MTRNDPASDTPPPSPADLPDDDALTGFLAEQDSPWLADELARAAQDDPVVRARLTAAAGLDDAVPLSEQVLRRAVLGLRPDAETSDDGTAELRRGVELLDDLVEYGYTEESALLAKRATELLRDARPGLDDQIVAELARRAAPDVQ